MEALAKLCDAGWRRPHCLESLQQQSTKFNPAIAVQCPLDRSASLLRGSCLTCADKSTPLAVVICSWDVQSPCTQSDRRTAKALGGVFCRLHDEGLHIATGQSQDHGRQHPYEGCCRQVEASEKYIWPDDGSSAFLLSTTGRRESRRAPKKLPNCQVLFM